MQSGETVLRRSVQELEDIVDDFRNTPFQAAENVIGRFIHVLDEEPLVSFLDSVLPPVEFDDWWQRASKTVGSMVGSGSLEWPVDRVERVALQIRVCRSVVDKRINFMELVHNFYCPGDNKLSAHMQKFADVFLWPLVRDIQRLTEQRTLPPALSVAMSNLPSSGDSTLDDLLREASRKFRDPAPAVRREAVEKLWDAWERLKTLESTDKKRSIKQILDTAAPKPEFRALLESEAKALTEIGNTFHIRHFETNKIPINESTQFDYLFHRLYALIHLLLSIRHRSG